MSENKSKMDLLFEQHKKQAEEELRLCQENPQRYLSRCYKIKYPEPQEYLHVFDYYDLLNQIENVNQPETQFIFIDNGKFYYELFQLTHCEIKTLSKECKQYLKEKFNSITLKKPFFMRAGTTSAKKKFYKSCIVKTFKDFIKSITDHLEIFEMAGWGHSDNIFCARELLPIKKFGINAMDKLPLTTEIRIFATPEKITGQFDYWEKDACLENAKMDLKYMHPRPSSTEEYNKRMQDYKIKLDKVYPIAYNIDLVDLCYLTEKAIQIASKLNGHYSIDFLKDKHGKWWLIDLAPAEKSYYFDRLSK